MDEGIQSYKFMREGAERGPMDEDICGSTLLVDFKIESIGV